MITKFTDSNNNICWMEYSRMTDAFDVWSEEYPNVTHTFDPEEVEELLDRGIWRRLS